MPPGTVVKRKSTGTLLGELLQPGQVRGRGERVRRGNPMMGEGGGEGVRRRRHRMGGVEGAAASCSHQIMWCQISLC